MAEGAEELEGRSFSSCSSRMRRCCLWKRDEKIPLLSLSSSVSTAVDEGSFWKVWSSSKVWCGVSGGDGIVMAAEDEGLAVRETSMSLSLGTDE